jgi:hypothetical protein
LAGFQIEVHHARVRARADDIDTNAGRFGDYSLHPRTVVKVSCKYRLYRRLREEKANDHSLLEVHVRLHHTKPTQGSSENRLIFRLSHAF